MPPTTGNWQCVNEDGYSHLYAALERYFSYDELKSPDTGVVHFAKGFADALLMLRINWNHPFVVGSCCRTADYNAKLPGRGQQAGHDRSLHVYDVPFHPTGGTAAIDIHGTDAAANYKLAQLAFGQGWSVGVASWGMHLDRRGDFGLEAKALFGY